MFLGLSFQLPVLNGWLGNTDQQATTIGGFLFATLVAMLFGLVASTLRWLVVDSLHHATGLPHPKWNFGRLQSKLQAFTLLEESHYRYYQFYGNMLAGSPIGYFAWRFAESRGWVTVADAIFVAFLILMFIGSRDTLSKYYSRVHELLRA
jgi:hypothetical protein